MEAREAPEAFPIELYESDFGGGWMCGPGDWGSVALVIGFYDVLLCFYGVHTVFMAQKCLKEEKMIGNTV